MYLTFELSYSQNKSRGKEKYISADNRKIGIKKYNSSKWWKAKKFPGRDHMEGKVPKYV